MLNKCDETEKTVFQARYELANIVQNYRTTSPAVPICSSNEHARRAGVSPEAVRYVKNRPLKGTPPSATDVRKIIRVLELKGGFELYALELITVGFPEPNESVSEVSTVRPTPIRHRQMPRLPSGRERASL